MSVIVVDRDVRAMAMVFVDVVRVELDVKV